MNHMMSFSVLDVIELESLDDMNMSIPAVAYIYATLFDTSSSESDSSTAILSDREDTESELSIESEDSSEEMEDQSDTNIEQSNEQSGMVIEQPTVVLEQLDIGREQSNVVTEQLTVAMDQPVVVLEQLNIGLQSSQLIENSFNLNAETSMDVNNESNSIVVDVSAELKDNCKTSKVNIIKDMINSPGSEDEGQICSICFEPWTNSGRHRLVAVKCGHLFGSSCIDKWLRGQGSKCPQCNAPAKRADLRTIFAKNLKVLDTTERDDAIKQLEKEKELRRRAELENAQLRLKCLMATQENERLKKELIEQKQWIQQARLLNKLEKKIVQLSQSLSVSLVLEKTLELCKDGGCKVLTSCDLLNMLVISQPSVNNLFPGYGIKKISTLDFRIAEFVSIHQKTIKDIAFHSHDAVVLTASLDKKIKLTNVLSNNIVQSYSLPVEAWSCVWSKDDPCQFFAGLRNGNILQFDTRMTNGYVTQLPSLGHKSPVVGLQYIQKQLQNPGISISGLLSCQLSTCCLYEVRRDSDYKVHSLPIEGNFTSLSYESGTGHFLISCRPSAKHSCVTHMLCELTAYCHDDNATYSSNVCSCNIVQILSGGTTQAQLSKSSLFLHPRNESTVLACAGDETSQAALLWDASTGQCIQQLKVNDPPVFDVQFFRSNQNHFAGTLTEKTLRLYKWTDI